MHTEEYKPATLEEAKYRWKSETRHVVTDAVLKSVKAGVEWVVLKNVPHLITLDERFAFHFLKHGPYVSAWAGFYSPEIEDVYLQRKQGESGY